MARVAAGGAHSLAWVGAKAPRARRVPRGGGLARPRRRGRRRDRGGLQACDASAQAVRPRTPATTGRTTAPRRPARRRDSCGEAPRGRGAGPARRRGRRAAAAAAAGPALQPCLAAGPRPRRGLAACPRASNTPPAPSQRRGRRARRAWRPRRGRRRALRSRTTHCGGGRRRFRGGLRKLSSEETKCHVEFLLTPERKGGSREEGKFADRRSESALVRVLGEAVAGGVR